MSAPDIARPFVIHVAADEPVLTQIEHAARSRGMSVLTVDLSGVSDRDALIDCLAEAFMFPYRVGGLDAALDLISDLEWFGNPSGYLVLARGLLDNSPIVEAFVSMLPNIVDRWRSQAVPFIVALDGVGSGLQRALSTANAEMERAGRLPWAQHGTGRVDVVVHGEGDLWAGQ
jgi:hypothetical protein